MIIYYNRTTHDCEKEGTGEIISIEQARKLSDDGQIDNCNMAFLRLEQYDWDPEKIDQLYRDMEKNRSL